jgi:hypothetical protein
MMNTENAKRPTSNAELIEVSMRSTSEWTVLSALLMRDKGIAPMAARIQAGKMLKGRVAIDTALAAELSKILRANRG